MKRDDRWTPVIGAALGCLLSLGSVGCLVSGFDLWNVSMLPVAAVCLIAAIVSSVCATYKRGGLLAVGLGVFGAAALHSGACHRLIFEITYEYYRVYGWWWLNIDGIKSSATAAVLALAAGIAAAVTWTVCRRRRAWGALTVTLLPLIACFVVTHTVPDEGYLACAFFGVVWFLMTHTARRLDEKNGNAVARYTALPLMLALAVVFMMIPQETYVNQAGEWRDAIANTLGLEVDTGEDEDVAARVNLSNIGRRRRNRDTVMEVTSSMSGPLYLRAQHYQEYTGTAWTITAQELEYVMGGLFVQDSLLLTPVLDISAFRFETSAFGEEETLTVTTEQTAEVLYVPYYGVGETDTTLVAGRLDNAAKLTSYTWTVYPLAEDWRERKEASMSSHSSWKEYTYSRFYYRDYTALPEDTVVWAQALGTELAGGAKTVSDAAQAIAAYVKTGAEYSLRTGKMPSRETDFARWFLEESDTGYCTHFATAAAVLLRAVGISARYVSGYMVDVQADVPTVVTYENAHAWVEYYEPLLGMWIPLECTPSDPDLSTPQTRPIETTTAVDTVETTATTTQPTLMTVSTTVGDEKESSGSTAFEWRVLLTAGAALLSVIAAQGQRCLRLKGRARRLASLSPNEKALWYWREAQRLAHWQKETPPDELERLANKAKFSQHTLTAEELAVFEDYRGKAIAALRTHAWYRRVWYRYVWAL